MDEHFINWLLGTDIPTIRYLTLVHLLKRPDTNAAVIKERQEMKENGPIPVILGHQVDTGGWEGEHSYYTPKYRSTHWSMLLLAELSADPTDPKPGKGAAFMLDRTEREAQQHIAQDQHGLECFWANLLRYALAFGNPGDPRLNQIVHLLTVNAPGAGWKCRHNDERPCAWGAARTLWGLASLPAHLQAAEYRAAIESGLEFLLEEYDLLEANYPVPKGGKVHPLWTRLNFPLFYQADKLLILRTLGELDALDHPGARSSLEWLASRRGRNGRWRGSSPYRGRTWLEMGDREETDRWVSLQAAMIIERSH